MSKNRSAIGIFDSGLGGLTVVKQIMRILPHENIIYLGDTARVPYGPRSSEIIKKFSEENTKFLLGKKVKCIVIACNTSSAVAGDHLKRKFSNIPVFEVIDPAAKEAAAQGKRVGVIGTRATIGSGAYEKHINSYSRTAKVFNADCPLLVPFIEEGEVSGKAIEEVSRNYLKDIKARNIDTLILGCTHYPIIINIIAKQFGKKLRIVDPGVSVAKEISVFLNANKMLNSQKSKGLNKYFVTDLTERFVKVAEMFLGHKILGSITKVTL